MGVARGMRWAAGIVTGLHKENGRCTICIQSVTDATRRCSTAELGTYMVKRSATPMERVMVLGRGGGRNTAPTTHVRMQA